MRKSGLVGERWTAQKNRHPHTMCRYKKNQQEQKTNKHCLKMIEHAREIQIENIHLIAKQILFKMFMT